MLTLTDEQIEELRNIWHAQNDKSTGYRLEFEAVLNAYHAMLNASPTHRVVEAPEGYEFHGESHPRFDPLGDRSPYFTLLLRPIPKPCPPPVLEPVTVTVESVYGVVPTIPEGYEAKFGRVDVLGTAGYGAAIKFDFQSTIADINLFPRDQYAIGLRKWEPR